MAEKEEMGDVTKSISESISPYYQKLKGPSKEYKLIYNSPYETMEPVYFWILDFLGYPDTKKVEKIVDNFASTPGSGHFSELMGKATRMQEEGMKVMQTIGVLIKSIINIIYDLRQFEIKLNDYEKANSGDKDEKEAGLIALKQAWMDNVDIKRGNTSLKALTFSQASFATLLDAFFAAKKLEDVTKKPEEGGLDLNERVKRILEQRIIEFEKWKELSEKELTKRFRIEKSYLKSQVDSLKLYSRWAKPYLKAAEQLKQASTSSAALVKAFNTINIQVVLLSKKPMDVTELVLGKGLPKGFEKLDKNKKLRKYYACSFIDLNFRGIPQKAEQHYVFGGRVDVSFKAFALNQDELDLFKYKLEQSDINEALGLVEGATQESLKEIQDDINYFLKSEEEKKKEEGEKKKEEDKGLDINPFAALLEPIGNLFNWKKFMPKKKEEKKNKEDEEKEYNEKMKKLEKEGIKPDSYAESLLRQAAEAEAVNSCFNVYDVYKKGHGMASVPFPDFLPRRQLS